MPISDKVTISKDTALVAVMLRRYDDEENFVVNQFFWNLLGQKLTDEEISDFSEAVESHPDFKGKIKGDIVVALTEWRGLFPTVN